MSVYYQDDRVTIHAGDCVDVLRQLPADSVDAIVTDPPYGLEFMGKEWDAPWKRPGDASARFRTPTEADKVGHPLRQSRASWPDAYRAGPGFGTWCLEWCTEAYRVLRPGGHLLAFGGTRTWHRLACAVEDAGFEIRDSIAWLYGSGFAKSWNFKTQFDGQWCECNPVPYSHVGNADLPSVRGDVPAATITRSESENASLFASVQRETTRAGMGHARTQGPGGVVARDGAALSGEHQRPVESVMEGRGLHRRQGLPEDPPTRPFERSAERLRVGTRPSDGADDRAPGGGTRGSAPHQRQAGRQSTGESAPLPGPHGALDDGALRDGAVCARCGGLDAAYKGFGSALKPAHEPIVVARKPLIGTVAQNVLTHGTGALNIDGCRISTGERPKMMRTKTIVAASSMSGESTGATSSGETTSLGRWPANVILDEWMEPVLRLRYNLPTEVERVIRESFGARTDHLPTMWDQCDGASEQGKASEILLSQVSGGMDVGEPDRRESATLGETAHEGDAGTDLGDEAGQPEDGRWSAELEGRPLPESRLRLHKDEHLATARAADIEDDGDAHQWDLHSRASARGGKDAGASIVSVGDSASHQRSESGQSSGESGISRFEQFASDEARRGRRGNVQTPPREREAEVVDLEMLRYECPPGWWQYFDVIGHRRCGQAAVLDKQSGITVSSAFNRGVMGRHDVGDPSTRRIKEGTASVRGHDDSGGASRFFPVFKYEPKAPTFERPRDGDGAAHPTVKPLDLMRWLVRLVTPRGGICLDPFLGSGTTAEACIIEGFRCIGIERDPTYLPLAVARLSKPIQPGFDFGDSG